MDFATRLKDARKRAGLTQEQLADGCGLATITIRQYELGKREPRYETVKKIAAFLHTSTGALIDGGPQLKYKVQQWKSRKDAKLEMAIDAELLDIVQTLADSDGLTLEDEVEKLLLEYTNILREEDLPQD